jgi:hypothetical protein
VSNLKVPAFDMLSGQLNPYTGFGDPLLGLDERLRKFRTLTAEAQRRVEAVFSQSANNPGSVSFKLDKIIDKMWSTGWRPNGGSLNLFATDFGLLLTVALNAVYGGELVFRSETDISHVSIWWSGSKIEAFPFHHVLKCLLDKDSDSISSFEHGLSNMLRQNRE